MEAIIREVKSKFINRFQAEPVLVASPGRINIIGEHTDYNNGFVLPAAIDKYIVGGFSKKGNNSCVLYSIDYDEELNLDLTNLKPGPKGSWANYVIGVIHEIRALGKDIGGFYLVIGGNIPSGAGLSSSAALENCVVFGLNELFQLDLSKEQMVSVSQKAEQNFVGVACGIMDQYASMFGEKDHAILLDCQHLEAEFIPTQSDEYRWVLLNTQVAHSLIHSPYNQRKEECKTGVEVLRKSFEGIASLRQANTDHLKVLEDAELGSAYQRCSYVVEENDRVLKAKEALRSMDWEQLGTLLYASHEGLQHKYEVSCPELDFLVDQTKSRKDVLGGRMMGGGFGGCTLNLVSSSSVDSFISEMKQLYQDHFNIELAAYQVSIVDGTQLMG